jgi:CoA:oxalate CoA-transferase
MKPFDVFAWPQMINHPAFHALEMLQAVRRDDRLAMTATRCPNRIDSGLLTSSRGAPRLGEHTDSLRTEFHLP